MALQEATPPPLKLRLGPMVEEVIDSGKVDTWYLIREYDKWPSCRDAAVRLRLTYPELEFTASRGTLYARRVK